MHNHSKTVADQNKTNGTTFRQMPKARKNYVETMLKSFQNQPKTQQHHNRTIRNHIKNQYHNTKTKLKPY